MSDNSNMLPSAAESECYVIAAMMHYNETILELRESCPEECFHTPGNLIVFQEIQQLQTDGMVSDLVTVMQRLNDRSRLDRAGGAAHVAGIFGMFPVRAHLESHVGILREKAALRRIIMAIRDAEFKAYQNNAATGVLAGLESFALELRGTMLASSKNELQSASEAVMATIDKIEAQMELARTTGLTGFSTGFKTLDAYTSGLKRKTLTLIGARPSVGKTALAIMLLHELCIKQGLKCLYITLEGTREQIVTRLTSQMSGISVAKINTGQQPSMILPALQSIMAAPLDIYRPTDMEFTKMEHHVAARDYDVVFIDYLQKARCGNQQLREQITQIANLAKDWGRNTISQW